jgi:hypothetical protein
MPAFANMYNVSDIDPFFSKIPSIAFHHYLAGIGTFRRVQLLQRVTRFSGTTPS